MTKALRVCFLSGQGVYNELSMSILLWFLRL